VSNILSIALLAGVFTLLVTQVAVRWLSNRRVRRFREHKGESQQTIFARFRPPALPDSLALAELKSLSALPSYTHPYTHQESKEAQNRYRAAVIRSGTCLFLAFLSLSLSATSLREFRWVELPIAWVEIIAIGLVIVYFLRARTAHRSWLKLRVAAELQRQYIYIKIVFPDLNMPAITADFASQAAVNLASIFEQVVNDRPGTDLISRIENFWQARRGKIKRGTLHDRDASYDRLLLYVHGRCLRQLGWFTDSRVRLEQEADNRKTTLGRLYVIAAALASLKFLSTLLGLEPRDMIPSSVIDVVTNCLLFLLLMIAGISAAMTAYYLNQNSRSLIHRYTSQERRIQHWCASFVGCAFSDANVTISKSDALDRVLEFEDMMIEELIDWIHISFNDVIELAP
jgi:hypothetical protein